MKEDKKEAGEELIDIDEKGNPIKDKKEEGKEKKTKSITTIKVILTIIVCLIILVSCYFFFTNKKSTKSVFDETTLKNLKLKNRVFFGIYHTQQK